METCTTPEIGSLLIAKTNRTFRISFTNEGNVTADVIQFRINLGTESLLIRDAGRFEPGVTINHVFKRRGGNVISSPLFAPAPFHCYVAATHFIDGTVWSPPSADIATQPGNAPTQGATPAIAGNGYIGVVLEQTAAGVVIHLVYPSSPAEKAGLRQGDLIMLVNDEHVASVADASLLISGTPPGTSLAIKVLRSGEQQVFTPIVSRRPDGGSGL